MAAVMSFTPLEIADQLEEAARTIRRMDRDLDRAVLVSRWMVFASKLPECRDRSELNKDIFAAAERIVARHGEWKQK